jgi:hypothetical protein
MKSEIDVWLRAVSNRQHALVGIAQVLDAGFSRHALRHRLRGPDWGLATSRVMRLIGAPESSLQPLQALVLDGGPGTAISGSAGAALWRLPSFDFGPLEASRLRGVSGSPLSVGRLHRPRYLPDHHVTTVAGIEVLTLPRTIFDLAPTMHPMRLARLIDTVTGRSPSVLAALHKMLEELSASGRSGITVMREILEARPPGYIPAASNLERRFEGILEEAGDRPMRRQVNLGGHDWIGRVDYVDDPPYFIAEIQSQTYHSALLDQLADERRFDALKAAGFLEVLPIPEAMVWHQPAEVLRRVRAARVRVDRQLRRAS